MEIASSMQCEFKLGKDCERLPGRKECLRNFCTSTQSLSSEWHGIKVEPRRIALT